MRDGDADVKKEKGKMREREHMHRGGCRMMREMAA